MANVKADGWHVVSVIEESGAFDVGRALVKDGLTFFLSIVSSEGTGFIDTLFTTTIFEFKGKILRYPIPIIPIIRFLYYFSGGGQLLSKGELNERGDNKGQDEKEFNAFQDLMFLK